MKKAFTLIELLVVIAILAILAALMLPALASAKGRAKSAWCLSNEHQLNLAWMLYAGDYGEHMAPNGEPPQGGDPTQKFWVQGMFYYQPDATNTHLLVDGNFALFAPYVPSVDVYLCPSDRSTVQVGGRTYGRLRSYALNSFMGWTGPWDDRLGAGYITYQKMSDMIYPPLDSVMTFIDVYPDSQCRPAFGINEGSPGSEAFFNYPSVSHEGGSASVAFADGHVQNHRWLDPRTLAPKSANFHAHDDPSPGNVDIIWMRQRASAPSVVYAGGSSQQ